MGPSSQSTTAPPAPRNLVVCCDGTNNEIGVKLSNVLKLYRVARKDDQQITYYQPGIGTIAMPDSWGRWRQKVRSNFEMTTGHGLDRDVLAAYCFLCHHYRPGDRIYLFGFSRGAYTARVLAGMIYLVGLLREHQVNFAGYALKAYKSARADDGYDAARSFQRIVNSECAAIHFMGLWDTVSSVIVPGRLSIPPRFGLEELPFTSSNPAVRTFRHAMAIDEFRRMFRLLRWDAGKLFKPNQHSQEKIPKLQDSREVWFPGCHSDVGGGFAEEESALSKFPLIWMLDQAKHHGLEIRTQMVNHIARGHLRAKARQYTKPDVCGLLHRSLTLGWRLLEYLPKRTARREWSKRRSLLGHYLPMGEPRPIAQHDLVHTSAVQRKARVQDYEPENLPPGTPIESMSGIQRSGK